VLDTAYFLLSVNVLSNSISAGFSFYYCIYSVLSQLSRTISNNGDSHKISLYQNVQTCILEVDSTRTLCIDIVHCVRSSLPQAKLWTSNMHRSNKEHTNACSFGLFHSGIPILEFSVFICAFTKPWSLVSVSAI